MACWNGLSMDQQIRLLTIGNLPLGYLPAGVCRSGAEVEVATMFDIAPGPRFYCRPCAIVYLQSLIDGVRADLCPACHGTDIACAHTEAPERQ